MTAARLLYKETLLEVVLKADGWVYAEVKGKGWASRGEGNEV